MLQRWATTASEATVPKHEHAELEKRTCNSSFVELRPIDRDGQNPSKPQHTVLLNR